MHSSTCRPPVRPASFVQNAVYIQLCGFGFFVKDQVTIGMWVDFWVFNSIPLLYISIFVPTPSSFYHYCSVIQFEVRDGDPLEVLLLLIVFALLGFWFF